MSASTSAGVGWVGVVLAMLISNNLGSTLGFTILHGFFGWLYVFYAAFTYPQLRW
ncbi:MAG: hypothetical protein WC700_14510 [Gemmatimonadaceae bacterium]|jgi:NADH:ubiquinone oxidoreductase subunit 2 (subunit N)